MKIKIHLDTYTDIKRLVEIATGFPDEKITVTDGNGLRANAKSYLGVISATEYSELWLETENEHYHDFRDFMQIED